MTTKNTRWIGTTNWKYFGYCSLEILSKSFEPFSSRLQICQMLVTVEICQLVVLYELQFGQELFQKRGSVYNIQPFDITPLLKQYLCRIENG